MPRVGEPCGVSREDSRPELRLEGKSATCAQDRRRAKVEDEHRRIAANDEDVEAHHRRVAANEEADDEHRRIAGHDDEGDEVEAHHRRVGHRRVS
jgi:hypothetical protein